jgi:hypothetical protein
MFASLRFEAFSTVSRPTFSQKFDTFGDNSDVSNHQFILNLSLIELLESTFTILRHFFSVNHCKFESNFLLSQLQTFNNNSNLFSF